MMTESGSGTTGAIARLRYVVVKTNVLPRQLRSDVVVVCEAWEEERRGKFHYMQRAEEAEKKLAKLRSLERERFLFYLWPFEDEVFNIGSD